MGSLHESSYRQIKHETSQDTYSPEISVQEFEPYISELRSRLFGSNSYQFPTAENQNFQTIIGKILESDDKRLNLDNGLRQSCTFVSDCLEMSLCTYRRPVNKKIAFTDRIFEYSLDKSLQASPLGLRIIVSDIDYEGSVIVQALNNKTIKYEKIYGFSGYYLENLKIANIPRYHTRTSLNIEEILPPGVESLMLASLELSQETFSSRIIRRYIQLQEMTKDVGKTEN